MAGLSAHLPPVPVLETARLRLRGHTPKDFEAFHAMWSDADVVRYLGVGASSAQESDARLLRHIGHWAAHGWGYWAVEDKSSGAFVGDLGFGRFRRAITPAIDHMPEMGWVLAPAYHGKGYATEAGRAALAWMDRAMPGAATCCIFHPDNAASMRVAEKLGFTFWVLGAFGGETPIYRRAAPRR